MQKLNHASGLSIAEKEEIGWRIIMHTMNCLMFLLIPCKRLNLTLLDAPVSGGRGDFRSDGILPRVLKYLNGHMENREGQMISRLVSMVYNLEEETSRNKCSNWKADNVQVPFGEREVAYDSEQ